MYYHQIKYPLPYPQQRFFLPMCTKTTKLYDMPVSVYKPHPRLLIFFRQEITGFYGMKEKNDILVSIPVNFDVLFS